MKIKEIIIVQWTYNRNVFPEVNNHYFIRVIDTLNDHYDLDYQVARIIKMNLKDYKQYLKDNFNAIESSHESFFKLEEDAKRAVEWVESQILLLKIQGKEATRW